MERAEGGKQSPEVAELAVHDDRVQEMKMSNWEIFILGTRPQEPLGLSSVFGKVNSFWGSIE
jgi:hypothetical protein